MSVLDAGSLPYPEMDIAEALRQLAPEDTALVRPYSPGAVAVDVPAAAVVVPPAQPAPTFTPVTREPLPVREPRASLPQAVWPARPQANVVILERTLNGLKRLPLPGEAVYAEAVAERYGTGPAAVVPAGTPTAPSPGALLADERARYRLAEIVYRAAREAEPKYGPYCADCKASDADWCDACARADEESTGLYRLHDLILAADTYAAAAVLVARSVMPPATLLAEGRR